MPYWRVKDLGYTGVAYPFRIDDSGRVAVATTDVSRGISDSVAQALMQLILTPKGSRFFNRSFGAKPRGLIFRRNVPEEVALWGHDLKEMLDIWEPRIELRNLIIVDQYESTCILKIGYGLRRTMLEGFVEAELPLE